jgi:hypothetical protein
MTSSVSTSADIWNTEWMNEWMNEPEIKWLLLYLLEWKRRFFAFNALDWTMQSQTKPGIAKSSCINKRENTVQLKLTDTIFFFGTICIHPLIFFKESWRQELAPNLMDPLDQAILTHWVP